MESFKKNYTCKECNKEFIVMQQKAYDEMKKNKKCFECKMKSEPVKEVKKENPNKILRYSYCCDKRKLLYERHIRVDCEDCNRNRHYKKYTIEGLKLPCVKHIIVDPFDGNCNDVCEHKCFINELSKQDKDVFKDSLKEITCSECDVAVINKSMAVAVFECNNQDCSRKFCRPCSINNMLMFNNEPETYNCFICVPAEKDEAIRLGQF